VPQSTQTVSSGPDTVAIDKVPKKKTRKHLKHTYMKTNDSIDKVRAFRVKGLTYKAIGVELNISKQRVFQIIAAGKKRDSSNNKWTAGLSSRNMQSITVTSYRSSGRTSVFDPTTISARGLVLYPPIPV